MHLVITRYHKNDKVYKYMTKFKRNPSEPYTLISPMSSLVDLEKFLETNLFALGKDITCFMNRLILIINTVTDDNRRFVLAVATAQDLEKFVTRRGIPR